MTVRNIYNYVRTIAGSKKNAAVSDDRYDGKQGSKPDQGEGQGGPYMLFPHSNIGTAQKVAQVLLPRC